MKNIFLIIFTLFIISSCQAEDFNVKQFVEGYWTINATETNLKNFGEISKKKKKKKKKACLFIFTEKKNIKLKNYFFFF